MNKIPIILRCAGIIALFAAGIMLFKSVVGSMAQVIAPLSEDMWLAAFVAFFGPMIIVVIFANAFREILKVTSKIDKSDPDSKMAKLEKRISELEQGRACKPTD